MGESSNVCMKHLCLPTCVVFCCHTGTRFSGFIVCNVVQLDLLLRTQLGFYPVSMSVGHLKNPFPVHVFLKIKLQSRNS